MPRTHGRTHAHAHARTHAHTHTVCVPSWFCAGAFFADGCHPEWRLALNRVWLTHACARACVCHCVLRLCRFHQASLGKRRRHRRQFATLSCTAYHYCHRHHAAHLTSTAGYCLETMYPVPRVAHTRGADMWCCGGHVVGAIPSTSHTHQLMPRANTAAFVEHCACTCLCGALPSLSAYRHQHYSVPCGVSNSPLSCWIVSLNDTK